MKEIPPRLKEGGQVNEPAEVRRAEFTLETAFASVLPLERPLSHEEVSRIAKEEKAERTVREMRRE
jgi:hypothetical protein